MAFDIAVTTHDYSGNEDRTWLATRKGFDTCRSVTLDVSTFDSAHLDAKGAIPSGTVLGKITATGKYGPYTGTTEEVNTITIDATGGTFTITYQGQTTSALAYNASAATVLAALEALSNVAPGDLEVTKDGSVFTITATPDGAFADTNVTVTTNAGSLTGGGSTATVATTTAGGGEGADGRQVAAGILFNTTKVGLSGSDTDLSTAADVTVPMLWEGIVIEDNLPTFTGTDDGVLDTAAKTDLAHIRFE